MTTYRTISALLLTLLSSAPAGLALAAPVSLVTSDGIAIQGDFRRPKAPSRGVILLFHMAGSNKAEYAPIAPILNRMGFATLAIDQRSGGQRWGAANETVAQLTRSASYAEALPDLDAAIDYGTAAQEGPVVLWGSSYSAALVFIAAARHPQVKALLAFSPGEYISGYSIAREASRLAIPVFITSSPDAAEVESARALADATRKAARKAEATQYVPRFGVHGAATLRRDENPEGASENWAQVTGFLRAVLPPR